MHDKRREEKGREGKKREEKGRKGEIYNEVPITQYEL
jgi:hypothetical protein